MERGNIAVERYLRAVEFVWEFLKGWLAGAVKTPRVAAQWVAGALKGYACVCTIDIVLTLSPPLL